LTTEITIIVGPTSAEITAADAALNADARYEGVPNTTYELKLTRPVPDANQVTMVLNIRYNDAGMAASEESSIRIFRLTGSSWGSALTDSNTPGADSNIAQVYLGSLSVFRCIIMDPVSGDLSRVRAFPNPFIPYDGDANTGTAYNGAANTGITFLGLTSIANLKIFTLDGVLVDEENFFGVGSCQWDAKNSQGQECASGMYFYLVTAEGGGIAKGMICIIR